MEQVVVVKLPTLSQPTAPSDSKSKVKASDAKLLSPCQIISKVRKVDDMEHTLNKGLWAGTGAMCQGWKVFANMSYLMDSAC